MDEVTLRSLLSRLEALETLRASLHSSLRFWEWVVVIGVVIELIVVIKEYRDDLHEFRRGVIIPPEKPSILLLALGLLGAGMVAFGISKELLVDAKIEGIETQIRGVNEQLFGIVKQSAEEAQNISGKALDKSSAANDAAGKAQEKVRAVARQADDTDERLKLSLSMLSVRTVRHLVGTEDRLKAANWKWPERVVVKSYSGDAEGFNACIQISLVMATPELGIRSLRVECGKEPLRFPIVVSGITISWPDMLVLMLLRTAFIADGGLGDVRDIMACEPCRPDQPATSTEMEIFVGVNPGFSFDRLEQAEQIKKKKSIKPNKPNP